MKKAVSVLAGSVALIAAMPSYANIMAVDAGTIIIGGGFGDPSGGQFKLYFNYDDSLAAAQVNQSTINNDRFKYINLAGYGPSSGSQGGTGTFTGSLTTYALNLTLTQATNGSPGFAKFDSTGARGGIYLSLIQGQATYSVNGVSTTRDYGCLQTSFSASATVTNKTGNPVKLSLFSEGVLVGGPARDYMCFNGYAFDPTTTGQTLLSVSNSQLTLATERLSVERAYDPNITWFAQSGSAGPFIRPFSRSSLVDGGSVPLPGGIGLLSLGLVALVARRQK